MSHTFCKIILILALATPLHAQNTQIFYSEGLEQLNSGNWSTALNIWTEGKYALEDSGACDPRIGLKYIEVVTERNLTHFYDRANEFYFWSLYNTHYDQWKEVINREVERLIPLVKTYDRKQIRTGWSYLIEDENSQDLQWKRLIDNANPEIMNRLKEFWIERDPTPTTAYNERLIEHWERIAYGRKHFQRAQNSIYGGDERIDYYVKYGPPSDERINTYTWVPPGYPTIDYVVWKHDDLYEGQDESLLNIFFRIDGEIFKHYASFESKTGIMRAGFFGAVYRQLMFFDEHFDRLYEESLTGQMYASTVRELSIGRKVNYDAPPEKSKYSDIIHPINLFTTQIRYLDEQNIPKLKVLAISSLQNQTDAYTLQHSLIERDKQLNEINRINHNNNEITENTSYFILDHRDQETRYMIAAEAAEPDTASGNQFLYAGKKLLPVSSPLDNDLSTLELSDIITGIDFPEYVTKDLFPFPILPTTNINEGDPLKIYFEIYHLTIGPQEKAQYKVSYQIERVRGKSLFGLLGLAKDTKNRVANSFELETSSTTTKETVEFDVSELKEGNYLFSVVVKDLQSGQNKTRSGNFRIIK